MIFFLLCIKVWIIQFVYRGIKGYISRIYCFSDPVLANSESRYRLKQTHLALFDGKIVHVDLIEGLQWPSY